MSNDKLIKSMLACDGSNKHCEGCTFRDIPDCRNAMAHHAGALIQLQDVVIANSGALAWGLREQIEEAQEKYQEAAEVISDLTELVRRVMRGLRETRHCESCEGSKPSEKPEEEAIREKLCEACRAGERSHWCLDTAFGQEPEAPEDDVLQPVEEA